MDRYIVKCSLDNILCTDNTYHANKLCGAGGYIPKIYKNYGYAKKQADIKRTLNGRVTEINELLYLDIRIVYGYEEKGKYLIELQKDERYKVFSFITINGKLEKCYSSHIANNMNSALTYFEAKDFIRQQNNIDNTIDFKIGHKLIATLPTDSADSADYAINDTLDILASKYKTININVTQNGRKIL